MGKGVPIDPTVLDHLNSKSVPQAPPTNHTHIQCSHAHTCIITLSSAHMDESLPSRVAISSWP